jgi:hypothetical protein
MNDHDVSCERVDERDLDTRYLAGLLTPEEAEAFEGHFFGCERCWELVQQGLGVRSAFQADAVLSAMPAGPVSARTRLHRRGWWGLAAAAGIAVVALGVWQLNDLSEPGSPEDVLRGGRTAFAVTPAMDREALTATWPQVADADVYRVRLYAADGVLVLERETGDTSVSVPVDSVATAAQGAEMFWQVQALDPLRNSVAGSDLTRAALPQR